VLYYLLARVARRAERAAHRAVKSGRRVVSEAADARYKVADRLAKNILRTLKCTERDVHREVEATAGDVAGDAERTRNGGHNRLKKTGTTTEVVDTVITRIILTCIVIAAALGRATSVARHFLIIANVFHLFPSTFGKIHQIHESKATLVGQSGNF